ncbi:MAG: DUF4810 domain-containing protein [Bacteroidales bacterium]|nr:DUF4810 domain-containing protein [Bacteroidales bacterium]
MKLSHLIAAGAACLLLSACGSSRKQLYSWYDYQDSSYKYTKEPTDENEAKLIKTYEKMIAEPKGSRKQVPPGMCAEIGYLYFTKGQKEKAVQFFEKEIELYPESALFIKRILDSVKQ